MKDPLSIIQMQDALNRRTFLKHSAAGIGMAALGALFAQSASSGAALDIAAKPSSALPGLPHFPAKAKRVIYLFQAGAPPNSTSSTTSPISRNSTARTSPPPSEWASASPA